MPKADVGPVPRRRGVTESHGWENWTATLVHTPMNSLVDALERLPEVAVVQRNVGSSFRRPDVPWWILVQIEGSEWIHVLADPIETDLAQRFSAWTGQKAMAIAYSDFSNFLSFTLYEGVQPTVEMGSDGRHFSAPSSDPELDEVDELIFGKFTSQPLFSTWHTDGYWREFENENMLLDALVREQDAYVPLVWTEENVSGFVSIRTLPEDVSPHISGVTLVTSVGPARAFQVRVASDTGKDAKTSNDPPDAEEAVEMVDDPDTSLKDLLEAAAYLLSLEVPQSIHVVRAHSDEIDELLSLPDEFPHVGLFGIAETPTYRMNVAFDPESRSFIAACRRGASTWTEVMRFRADGNVLIVTGAENDPAYPAEIPGKTTIRLPNAFLDRLLQVARNDTAVAREFVPEDFPSLFEAQYAAEAEARTIS